MKVRDFINGKLGIAAAAVVIIVAAVTFASMASKAFRGVDHYEAGRWLYFMDEDTRAISIHPFTDISPQFNSQGKPTIVRACFFSADDGKTKQLMYLLKYSDEGRKQVELARQNAKPGQFFLDLHLSPEDMLIRSPEPGASWVPEQSDQSRSIRNHVNGLAGPEGRVIECFPKSMDDTLPAAN